MTTIETLAQFGKTFQEGLMRGLLTDQKWAQQMEEVFVPEYFDLKYLQFLSERYFQYSKKYRLYPTLQLLVTIIRDELKAKQGSDELLCDQIVDYLKRMQIATNDGDLPFIKEKSLDFCRKQALRQALENAVDAMEANKYESIVADIKRATMVGTAPSIGHDFSDDIEARFTPLMRAPIPTGIPELDHKDILNGGVGKGELNCVVAATGVGKSHFLVMMGCEALKRKLNVVHYTFELSENLTGNRYDSYLCEIDASNVIESKDEIIKKYADMKLGKLIIKYYSMNTASVMSIQAHIERLKLRGISPDLIVIDYADKMKSSRKYDQLRLELTLVYEELRCLAGELGVPIWTASQSNKEGSSSDVVDLTNMSESYGKAQTCDVVIGISRQPQEKSLGIGRLFIAKNRAGRDGIVYPIGIDTAQSRFVIRGEKQLPDDVRIEDDQATKQALRKKWEEVKKDQSLKIDVSRS